MPTSGNGYLAGESPGGTTTVDGVVTSAEVRVYFEETNGNWTLVGTATSAANGTWQILNLDPSLSFNVIGRKSGYEDVLHVGIRPTRTDLISFEGALSLRATLDGVDGFLSFVGGLPPYTVNISSPLPYGLSPVIDGRRLVVDGTSTDEGEWHAVLRVTSSNAVSVQIPVDVVVINGDAFTASLPGAFNNQSYSGAIQAKSFLSPPIAWSVVGGALPSGLSVTGSTASASVVGTPNDSEGAFQFRVRMESHTGAYFEKNLTVFLSASAPMEAEALQLFGRMSPAPDATRKVIINNLILALKAAGAWSGLDFLHVMAAHSKQAALLNWVDSTRFNLVENNSPKFVVDEGFTGNGSNMSLTIGDMRSSGMKSRYEDSHLGIYTFNANVGNAQVLCGSDNYWAAHNIKPRLDSTLMAFWLSADTRSSGPVVGNTVNSGFFSGSRNTTAGGTLRVFHNGRFLATPEGASSAGNWPYKLYYLRQAQYESWLGDLHSSNNVAIGIMGKSLTDAQVAKVSTALSNYLTAIGKL